jgi:hypothetical protein
MMHPPKSTPPAPPPAARRLVTLAATLALLAPSLAPGEEDPRHELYFAYNAMSWKEKDAAGEEVLREKGYTLGLHLRSHWRAHRRVDLRTEMRGFTGTLDYDGRTFAGAPLQTATEYLGLGAAADGGLPFALGQRAAARIFAGLAADGWIRGIDNTGRLSGEGYDELWFTLEAVMGLALSVEGPEGYAWFLEPALSYPVYQQVAYDLTFPDGTDDVRVEPGREPGYAVEAGLRTARLLAAARFAVREYGRSDGVAAGPFTVLQPASEQEAVSFRLGIRF